MNHNQLQAACYKYFRETYPEYRHLLFSVNNNLTNYGGNVKQRMGILLSLGVHKGVTDFILYFKGRMYGMDIKIGYDKLSTEQIGFINAIREQGGDGFEVRSLEFFSEKLREIFGK